MGGACCIYWGERRRIEGFNGETGGKEPLGRSRRRWENVFFYPLFGTICPETFSNLCVESVRDMQEIRPVKFSLLLSIERIDVVTGERIMLRQIFKKWDVGVWTGSMWLTIGPGSGHL
jgi:hypothetical protein